MNPKATDWDAYYKRPAAPARITRRISSARILRTLRTHLAAPKVDVCEIGGANSCFVDDFLQLRCVDHYHVVDNNRYGLELVQKRLASDMRVSTENTDVLTITPREQKYDVVFSVGLIEHFDPYATARCIDAHFDLCREGGVVLVTFPTPTLPYRAIRSVAESAGVWAFPDERPLHFDEVVRQCRSRGEIEHQSINWWIGLSQGYVSTRKTASDRAEPSK